MGPYKKICEYCGKEFEARNITQKYCCAECRHLFNKENYKEYHNICQYCGNEFIAHGKDVKYCSDDCRRLSKNSLLKDEVKICKQCGKEFTPVENTQKYCSDKCRHRFYSENSQDVKNICKQCGKSFFASSKYVKYCSDECRTTSRAKNKKCITMTCLRCGNEFIAHSKKAKFCSDNCRCNESNKKVNKYRDFYHVEKTCVCCNKQYYAHFNSKFCSDECMQKTYAEKQRNLHIEERNKLFDENSKEGYDYVVCPICNQKFKQITMLHFNNVHNVQDRLKLFQMYPNLQMTCQRLIDENLKGENNPQSKLNTTEEQRKRSSPYSLEHYLYSKGAKSIEEATEMRQVFLDSLDRSNWENASRIEYYLKRGYTKEEAIRIRREKCTSNGLDYYIEKYGEEVGTEKFNKRLKYWKKQLYKGNHHSKIADEFFQKLSELYDKKDNIYFGDHEYMLTYDGKVILPDFLDVDNKKIIEFYGDYWHCNPNKYIAESYNKSLHKYASEIWDRDEIRVDSLNMLGYDVLVIWESDYREHNEEILNDCIEFLCG